MIVYATPGPHGALVYSFNHALPYFEAGAQLERPGYYDLDRFRGARAAVRLLGALDLNRARLGQELEELNDPRQKFSLAVVPSAVCAMRCHYCYFEPHAHETQQLNYELLRQAIAALRPQLGSITVYGGEPLLLRGLPQFLRQHFDGDILISTGLGLSLARFNAALDEVEKASARLSVSIDPPPEPGCVYSRVYPLFGQAWYRELLARFKRALERADAGVHCTLSKGCLDFRRLRHELVTLTGVPYASFPMTVSPVSECNGDLAAHARVNELLQQDCGEVRAKTLDLKASPFASLLQLLDPQQNFGRGGCFAPKNLELAYDGTLSFCSRAKGLPEYQFSTVDEMARLMTRVLPRNNCQACLHRYLCGTYCHVSMGTAPDNQEFACFFHRRRTEMALDLVARSPGVETLNALLDQRIANLRRWAAVSPDQLRHGLDPLRPLMHLFAQP